MLLGQIPITAHWGWEEKYQVCDKKNTELSFYVYRHICHENKATHKKIKMKKTILTTGSSDNELSGALVHNGPTHCAQQLQRQFLLLPFTNDLLFPWHCIFFQNQTISFLCTLQISSNRALGTKEIHGAWRIIWIRSPTQHCYVANVHFIRDYPKGENSYLSIVTEFMWVLSNLVCFCIFMIGSVFLKKETIPPST